MDHCGAFITISICAYGISMKSYWHSCSPNLGCICKQIRIGLGHSKKCMHNPFALVQTHERRDQFTPHKAFMRFETLMKEDSVLALSCKPQHPPPLAGVWYYMAGQASPSLSGSLLAPAQV